MNVTDLREAFEAGWDNAQDEERCTTNMSRQDRFDDFMRSAMGVELIDGVWHQV